MAATPELWGFCKDMKLMFILNLNLTLYLAKIFYEEHYRLELKSLIIYLSKIISRLIFFFFKFLSVIVGQQITDEKSIKYFDLLQNFEQFGWELYVSYFTTAVITLFFCLLISRLTISKKSLNEKKFCSKVAFLIKNFFSKANSLFKPFLICLSMFLWINQMFIINSIKTNKVIVDDHYLIKNRKDVLNTEKIFCFLEDNTVMHMAKLLPKSFLLSKLLYEKSKLRDDQIEERAVLKRDRCIFKRGTFI